MLVSWGIYYDHYYSTVKVKAVVCGCVLVCECSVAGSLSTFCDAVSGQCHCIPGVVGRQCNKCEKGYYNFPNCLPCKCNGRADECDDVTGACLQCRANTGGNHCELCAPGFYGNTSPSNSPYGGCKPCLCPGGVVSGYQHADTCQLNLDTGRVECDCRPEYAGKYRCVVAIYLELLSDYA